MMSPNVGILSVIPKSRLALCRGEVNNLLV